MGNQVRAYSRIQLMSLMLALMQRLGDSGLLNKLAARSGPTAESALRLVANFSTSAH